jgi:hypothetical protein
MQTFGPRQYFVRANTLFCRQCFVAANILSSPIFCLCLGLKVVGNEKGGGTGGWLLFKDGSVVVAVVFTSKYFRFLFVKPS